MRSADPPTLLTKSSTNRYDSSALLCRTARIKIKRGVAKSIDFEIDFEGILSIYLYKNIYFQST